MARFIDHREVGKRIPFAASTILNWAYRRKPAPAGFPAPVKVGGKLVWLESDLDSWIQSHSSLPPSHPAPQAHEAQAQTPRRGRGRPRKNQTAANI